MQALLVLLCVWSLLVLAALVAPWTGVHAAVLASYACATVLLLATRRRSARAADRVALVLGLVAGYASFPAWVAATVCLGLCIGLEPRLPCAPGREGLPLWLALLVAAPVFEELLYRERLFDALRPRLGAGTTIAVTSGLFALPHLEPWNVVGALLVGLGLGGVRELGGPISSCIAIHAGLNLASLLCGSPPTRLAASPLVGAAVGVGCVGALLARRPCREARRHAARRELEGRRG